MKQSLFFFFLFVGMNYTLHAQTMVFRAGEADYHTFRIPAIVRAPDNALLAFCEARKDGAGDYGKIGIVLRRSTDNGKSWSRIYQTPYYGFGQNGNPAPVVDMLDPKYPKGKVMLFFNTGNNHENEIRKGNGIREVWYTYSTTNGINWSIPVNITTFVHRPNHPKKDSSYHFAEDWRTYANTPGHAIQLQQKPYKGRIYVPANHSSGPPQNKFEDYAAHGFYTDDHGKTFQLAATVNMKGSNESTAAELSKGKLMLNSRNQQGDIRTRIVSISSNGGQTWDTSYYDAQLPDPVNQGTLLNLGYHKGKAILAFCNAASANSRDSLTLRISMDEGKTWTKQWLIDHAPADFKGDYTAYCDLVAIDKKTIGILYERKGYKQIVFKTIRWR